MTDQSLRESLLDWKRRETLAESMIPLIGRLYRDHNVSCYMYGRSLVNRSVIEIIKAHKAVRHVETVALGEAQSFPIVEGLIQLGLGPARVDVGKLAMTYAKLDGGQSVEEFLRHKIGPLADRRQKPLASPQDVVLYGFGRIGRLVARLLIEKSGGGDVLQLRAIVLRRKSVDDLEKRASLLRRDSVHGPFQGTIAIDHANEQLICNGTRIQMIYTDSPVGIDYESYGISNAVVVDNTGVWRDEEGLGQHANNSGVSKVLLTAPGKGAIPNIVYGINDEELNGKRIVSAASCTTNAIVPVLKSLMDRFGIERGHVETVHAYTNDQNLIDNFHKKARRGRGAPLNMVLTETGAASAVAKAIPELEGKLTGNAIRVPTPNVSMAILNLQLSESTDRDELNAYVREMSLDSPLQQQIGYSASQEVVSSDFVGSRHACIFDSQQTIVRDKSCVLYCWYDNEFGYSCQVVRCVEKMAGDEWAIVP